jgi:3',5'-cyclic AMP phosphodiesterase CpdA
VKKLVAVTSAIALIAFCILLVLGLPACAPGHKFAVDFDATLRLELQKAPAFPEANFAVFSDPHVYATNLGTSGKAFEDYLLRDRKLLRESTDIITSAVASIGDLKSSFVLVIGDMTKDGELESHLLAAQYLARLKASGKKVYVVPGNHDIMNGHSYRYAGDLAVRVPNITAEDFVKIYGDCGFNDALQRDTDSLSYVAEPAPGLWLLALDSCLYRDNIEDQEPVTGGRFSPQTLTWIEDRLEEAARSDKAVIVMMHHGALEHYAGQAKDFGMYLVDDYKDISRLFADYNVRLVFTGHYHSQDITVARYADSGNKYLFDVETGSLVTYPSPYRTVTIADQRAIIKTQHVTSIASHPQDFPEYARSYTEQGIVAIATKTLMGYKIDRAEAEKLAKEIAVAFVAHYYGDESLTAGKAAIEESGLSPLAWIVIQFRKDLVYGLWKDLPPPDNDITIELRTGTW